MSAAPANRHLNVTLATSEARALLLAADNVLAHPDACEAVFRNNRDYRAALRAAEKITAAMKAKDEGFDVSGSAMASDAFFPFRDGLDVAAEYGIKAVIQPGGSMRDQEVIAAADEHGIAMVLTGMRHFRH